MKITLMVCTTDNSSQRRRTSGFSYLFTWPSIESQGHWLDYTKLRFLAEIISKAWTNNTSSQGRKPFKFLLQFHDLYWRWRSWGRQNSRTIPIYEKSGWKSDPMMILGRAECRPLFLFFHHLRLKFKVMTRGKCP